MKKLIYITICYVVLLNYNFISAAGKNTSQTGWRIYLKASTNNALDSTTVIGTDPRATDGFDNTFDKLKPPLPPTDYVAINIFHPEWDLLIGSNFTTDIRSPIIGDECKSWKLNLVSTEPTAALSWSIFNVPAEQDITLYIGADSTIMHNLKSISEIILNNNSDFTIKVGKNLTSVEQIENKASKNYMLHQNYPNPFNAETLFNYQLHQGQEVQISIYNILGQKICTLINKFQDAGIYSIKWNGKDENDKLVQSGIYIYRLKTESYSMIKKMMFLR